MSPNDREAARLKQSGLKNTRKRNGVLQILEENCRPVTAEKIFLDLRQKSIDISLSTVYRILDVLVEKEIVLKISSTENDSAMFELNRRIHRHYLVCLGCRKMIPVDGCPLGELEKQLERETGFAVTGHNLEIYGYCSECRKKREQSC